jgi:hypothetical protein
MESHLRKIVLISCSSKKLPQRTLARDLYIGPLFKKHLQYALKLAPDKIFILSAKYGLVELDEEIDTYDLTLNTMSTREMRHWAVGVLHQLSQHADIEHDVFVFLAGAKYRKYLASHMAHVEVPLEGLPIGRQLQRLNEETKDIADDV